MKMFADGFGLGWLVQPEPSENVRPSGMLDANLELRSLVKVLFLAVVAFGVTSALSTLV